MSHQDLIKYIYHNILYFDVQNEAKSMLTSDIHMKSIASTTYVIYSLELEQQSKNESIGLQISCRYSIAQL